MRRNVLANGVNDPGNLHARREGALRAQLISVLPHQQVGIVQATNFNGDSYLARCRNRLRYITDRQVLDWPG
jgi:hypothetical protein